SLAPHACHVTRDVEADGSRRGVAREGQRAAGIECLDVAVAVALVAEAVTAAEARDVLQLVAVLDRVPVQPLNLAGRRELGKMRSWQRLDVVADLVSGYRRGSSASGRPDLPGDDRSDGGRAAAVQECPAPHRWSSSPGVVSLHRQILRSSCGLIITPPLTCAHDASARLIGDAELVQERLRPRLFVLRVG